MLNVLRRLGNFLPGFVGVRSQAGTLRPAGANGYFTGNGRTSQGQDGCWYDSQDRAGREDSRTSNIICWTPIDGKDRYCFGCVSVIFSLLCLE